MASQAIKQQGHNRQCKHGTQYKAPRTARLFRQHNQCTIACSLARSHSGESQSYIMRTTQPAPCAPHRRPAQHEPCALRDLGCCSCWNQGPSVRVRSRVHGAAHGRARRRHAAPAAFVRSPSMCLSSIRPALGAPLRRRWRRPSSAPPALPQLRGFPSAASRATR